MRIVLRIAMISALLLIVGCSNKNLVTESDSPKEPLGDTYGFTAFDVAIDTKEIKGAVTANYDEKRDKTEATYENQMEDFYLHGDKAMEKLNKIFEELSLEPDMDDVDIIKQASEAFEVIDYETLKLTVKFKGHDKKVLMMTK
ncbi:YusW family protein [Sporosarcina sp. E16_8]|uniref:YusW family protein n=1 Tax=Sporosarcina sp. E16_8 TaxID=2789295 RepID=UPI002102297B|nr:YusW family protein [Sporosarcina sp. E16_8]